MSGFRNCKGCEERQVGCHTTCERYLLDKNEHEVLMEKIKLENELYSYTKGSVAKKTGNTAMKRKRLSKYYRR